MRSFAVKFEFLLAAQMLNARPGLASVLIHGCGLVLRLAFMLAILRWSSPTVLGHYALLTAIEVVAVYLAGLEFHTFTTRRYARRPTLRQLRICASSHQRMVFVSAPLCAALGVGAAVLFALDLSPGEVLAFALIAVGGTVAQEVGRFMVLAGRPVHSVAMTFVRTAAWQPLAIPMFGRDEETLRAIIFLWCVASTLGVAWGLWIMREALGSPARPPMRYLTRGIAASRRYFLIASASVLQGNLERFVLQVMLGPASVAMFSFFQTLANTLPALVQSAVLNVSLSTILTGFGQALPHRMDVLRRLARRCLKLSLLLAVLICAAAVPLVATTSHPEYREYLWIPPILVAGQVLLMGSQPVHLALYGAHRDASLMWLSLASLALALALSVVLVATAGLHGAVVSTLLGSAGLTLARLLLFRHSKIRGLV